MKKRSHHKKNWSFAKLGEQEKIHSVSLLACLKDYATSGASISASWTIDCIKKCNPSSKVVKKLCNLAKIGQYDQQKRNFPICANEYKQVYDFLIDDYKPLA